MRGRRSEGAREKEGGVWSEGGVSGEGGVRCEVGVGGYGGEMSCKGGVLRVCRPTIFFLIQIYFGYGIYF